MSLVRSRFCIIPFDLEVITPKETALRAYMFKMCFPKVLLPLLKKPVGGGC